MKPVRYEIIVRGQLSADHWRLWFEEMAVSPTDIGDTCLSGCVDQPQLHGLLAKIRDLGLVLVAVTRLEQGPAQ